jgi:hypothetical protein
MLMPNRAHPKPTVAMQLLLTLVLALTSPWLTPARADAARVGRNWAFAWIPEVADMYPAC